jgi:hypothetical protein
VACGETRDRAYRAVDSPALILPRHLSSVLDHRSTGTPPRFKGPYFMATVADPFGNVIGLIENPCFALATE